MMFTGRNVGERGTCAHSWTEGTYPREGIRLQRPTCSWRGMTGAARRLAGLTRSMGRRDTSCRCGVWEDERIRLIVFRQAVVTHRSVVFVILQEVDRALFLGAVELARA